MAAVAGDGTKQGLDPLFNPDFFLDDEQKELRDQLIEICEREIKPRAAYNDETLTFPRESLEALGPFLGLLLPKEWGGLGQSHTMLAVTTETIARYGDASAAMCYTMHIGAVEALRLCANEEQIEKYLKKVTGGLLGTLSYSDPETGSHFWYPISSNARRVDGGFQVTKKASWTTSGGFADFYVFQTTSPDFKEYSDLSVFVCDASEVEAEPSKWDALGLRGNQSGSLLIDDRFIPDSGLVGRVGDGAWSNDEAVDPFFLISSSACWNGISLGAIDIACRHTTRKTHKDVGMRVCDYPTIQDAVGEAIIDTNAVRCLNYSIARALDDVTEAGQKRLEPGEYARGDFLPWLWQLKFAAAKNVAHVVDKMLHCCGGTAYKKSPLDLERYLRDGKAGWVMGPTNEVLRQFVGKTALLGMESLDYWNQVVNERAMHNEIKKLSADQKRELAERLIAEADGSQNGG
jgi:alkylation response protein AidB-like acyl-CoA dehydrogenase